MESLLQVGDGVIVQKADHTHPYQKGWQGRVTEIKDGSVRVEWDSLTLKALPSSYMAYCTDHHHQWDGMWIPVSHVAKAAVRDKPADVKAAYKEARWHYLLVGDFGRQGKRIYRVIQGYTLLDSTMLVAWRQYLDERVRWPFRAVVDYLDGWDEPDHFYGFSFLSEGLPIKVLRLDETDDGIGLVVKVYTRGDDFLLPLCNVSPKLLTRGRQAIEDYRLWFELR
jgi:hypothetical protein